MSGDLALGVDLGTGGARTALIDRHGALIAAASASLAEICPDRRDPATWEGAVALALSRLGTEADLGRVGALAVDATSGTVLALDAGDAPVGAALMYDDAVDDPAIPAAVAALAPRESAAHGPASALARAIVLQDRPGVRRIAHQADWIADLFSGPGGPSDESDALKTGYDPVARRWPDWLARSPLRAGLLPAVLPVGARRGAVTAAAARRFGLPQGAPVAAGLTDGCASFLATGAGRPGDGVTALGTTLTIKLLSDRPVFAPEYGIYSHRIGEIWLAGGASNTGGGALAAQMAPERIAELSARIDPEADSGLDYYPLAKPGERFPVADPAFAPRLTPRPDDDAAFLHGLLEGVARVEALGYRRLAELGAPPLAAIRSVGGGAANAVWTRMRARILGVPALAAASDAAAVGAARVALPLLAAP
ncbi:FGGY-family carbohydrate kinase [Rubrimonas cliftonensis]|uniref:Sugar (Pentulose or hexulose) kinase n=1 Tax=Rubrimonas cliftonensis TaxID=89524 RepID=A0A1H4C4B8_9RHOB|nr:FGGY-family carbohydrate kinase [Rubrimonas cliftonensis]SEA55143.1 Sugar (pentulose or hexulose) kinase [Rubrimonas cliftonensis]